MNKNNWAVRAPIFIFSLFLLLSPILPKRCSAMTDLEGEVKIGQRADKEIVKEFGLINDKRIAKYVDEVGQRVVAGIREPLFEYHFKVIDTEDINAFALPGGYIYITRGMLAFINNEAELAVILGHEVGHVTMHHGIKKMQKANAALLVTILGMVTAASSEDAGAWAMTTTALSQNIITGYGRDAEMQSDQLAIAYASQVGYDPKVIASFFSRLKNRERFGGHGYHGFLASHPDTIDRIIFSSSKAEAVSLGRGEMVINRDRYLDLIDGLPYGRGVGNISKNTEYLIKVHNVLSAKTLKEEVVEVTGDIGRSLEIALINGLKATSLLKPGDRIKMIVKAR
ncbi:MAG: M48 family metallopeptidase [Nitrospinota bacterium]|nr:M48 family metalloprotease [Nitrospinota bacterium]